MHERDGARARTAEREMRDAHGRDKTGGGGELEQTCETAATETTHLSALHPSTHEHRRLSTCNGHIVYAKTGPFVGTTLECLYSMLIPSTLNGVIMIGHSRWRCLPFPRKQFKRQDGCCVPAVLGDTKSVVFCVYVVCAVHGGVVDAVDLCAVSMVGCWYPIVRCLS